MKKVITFSLDPASITQAIAELRAFREDFMAKCDAVLRELSEEVGLRELKWNVIASGKVDTGELANSMHGVYNAKTRIGILYSDSEYAVFAEYGTGIVGAGMAASYSGLKGGPHPEADIIGWAYDVKNHSAKGWVYYDAHHGWFRRTRGQIPGAFMWMTKITLRESVPEVVKKVFGGGGE